MRHISLLALNAVSQLKSQLHGCVVYGEVFQLSHPSCPSYQNVRILVFQSSSQIWTKTRVLPGEAWHADLPEGVTKVPCVSFLKFKQKKQSKGMSEGIFLYFIYKMSRNGSKLPQICQWLRGTETIHFMTSFNFLVSLDFVRQLDYMIISNIPT